MHGFLKARVGGRKTRSKNAIAEFSGIQTHKRAHSLLIGKKVIATYGNTRYAGRVYKTHGLNGKVVVRFGRSIPQQAIQERIPLMIV